MNRRDAGLLLLLGAIWGAIYPLTSVVLREMPPAAIVVARTGLSAMVLIPFAARSGALNAVRARAGAVLIAALLQVTVPLLLLTIGQQYVGAALAAILVATQPVWAAVLSTVLTRTIPWRLLAGVILGLTGVALLFLRNVDVGGTSGWGAAALVAAAAFIAAGSVWAERAIPEVPPLGTATAAMTISALVLAPAAGIAGVRLPGLQTIEALLVLSLVSTAGALVLFYVLIQRMGAARANLAGYLDPGFAVAYSMSLLGERVSPGALVGLVLIITGSYIGATR
ncbi:ABC transporter permease [Planotetraspora thailandica]|uniref:ABC transporter permease n=1 Tax=Planotetraspora thailandica TaxID=487172 RepID=A0A8J3UX16_9ACTN|nr:DMT family transporter [Planotetraspora thailandica]GII52823.1 ABC transporter permease [Planotetraspora thailandica]